MMSLLLHILLHSRSVNALSIRIYLLVTSYHNYIEYIATNYMQTQSCTARLRRNGLIHTLHNKIVLKIIL
jgi:hypothetical protein